MTTHSPYVLTSLNVLMKVALAKEKKLDEKMKEMLEYDIPISWYSAYCMTDEGKMENIVDDDPFFWVIILILFLMKYLNYLLNLMR